MRQRLAQLQLDRGGPVLDLVRPLLDTGIGGPVFVAAAREALARDPALAARLFEASTGGGTPSAETAAVGDGVRDGRRPRRARCAWPTR